MSNVFPVFVSVLDDEALWLWLGVRVGERDDDEAGVSDGEETFAVAESRTERVADSDLAGE